jgi:hypothetical protein
MDGVEAGNPGAFMDAAQVRAALAAADELPYGRERTAQREDLVTYAERCGDLAVLASALLSLADDCQEDGENEGMVVGFGRAWRIWQTRPEAFDAQLRFRFREHFQHVVDVLNEDERVPAAEVDRLMDEMEAFYRAGGYSLRAVHRSRYWIHRRRGETEQANRQIEALLAEQGDSGASCDACDLATAAYWYEKQDDLPKAVSLWLTIIDGVPSCDRPHVGIAHGEVMIDLLNLERFDEARRHHLLGYPAIRRRRELPRQLELHALFVNRTRDVLRGMELLHDHVDWLPADRHGVGEFWWVHGRFLLFLKLLVNEGHGDLPVTLPAGRVGSAAALYGSLDAVLADYAAHQDSAEGGTQFAETLETWRTAKLRHDVLPPPEDEDADSEAGLAPIPAPWADRIASRPLPPGFEPVDALAARARCLSFLGHPHAGAAWERVAACGGALSEDLEAELAESRGVHLARRAQHAAARAQLAIAAALYAGLGRTADLLRCRAMGAYEVYLVGDDAAAEAEFGQVRAAAQAEFEAGRVTGGQLVTVRLYGLYRHLDRWRRLVDAEPDVDEETSGRVSRESSAQDREFRELASSHGATPQYAAAVRSFVEVTAAIGRMFAREGDEDEAAGYVGRLLDRLGDLVELYAAVYQPWFAAEMELRRGQEFLLAGQPADAERCARQTSAWNSPPAGRHLLGPTALLLAEAVNAQGGRDEEVTAAATRAAQLLAGADPVGTARARLLMGEVHFRAGRYETAELFYHPALVGILGHWEDDACRQLIHHGALHYATGLGALKRERDAVRLLRTVLAAVPEDYANARAWLLHTLAEAAEQADDADAALEAYRAAVDASRRAAVHQPAVAALESAARLLAPTDIRAALGSLDEAMAHLRAIEDPDASRRRDFLIAEARTLGLKYLLERIEKDPIPDEEAAELFPPAREAAEAGIRELWALLDGPQDGDERDEFVQALETALRPLTLAALVFEEDAPAAARWHSAFAEGCERWGFPDYVRTARENAEYFAGRAQEEQQGTAAGQGRRRARSAQLHVDGGDGLGVGGADPGPQQQPADHGSGGEDSG